MTSLSTGTPADMASQRTPSAKELFDQFIKWLYYNLCGYGIQIQRTAHRIFRKTRRALRPVGKYLSVQFEKIRQPLIEAGATLREIGADTKRVLTNAGAAAKSEGIRSAAAMTARSAANGAVKHKTFLASAVNHVLPVVCITIMLLTAAALFGRNYVLAVEYDGNLVGYVSDENTYNDATDLVSERVINASEDFQSALTPVYSLVPVSDDGQLNTSAEICNNILINSDNVDQAYGFFVNDKLIAAIKSQGDMTFILDTFLEQYRIGAANETMSFVGETEIVSGLYSAEKIVSSSDFQEAISAEQMATQLYTVRSGNSVESIVNKFGMTEERFLELNEDFDGNLREGDTVLVEKEQPVLRVQSVVVSSYEKKIAYSTITERDSTKYTTYNNVKQQGKDGVQKVTQEIVYIDGVEVSRTVIDRETLVEPVDKIVVVGTKKTTTTRYNAGGGSFSSTAKPNPNVNGTGRFTWPLPGVNSISSYYGMRWGRLHSGIDISCSGVYGRTIVAADAGTVTSVKNSPSGYGLHLIINHGNGYTTLYAHCSSILVSAGQTVSKGQAIAKVGNSGRSTGPHLHFEIRVNGSAKNPMNWF